MAKVIVKNENKVIELEDGADLKQLNGKTNIIFACNVGICGACKIKILKGKENLNDLTDAEKTFFESTGEKLDGSVRLACQVVIKQGEVEIEY